MCAVIRCNYLRLVYVVNPCVVHDGCCGQRVVISPCCITVCCGLLYSSSTLGTHPVHCIALSHLTTHVAVAIQADAGAAQTVEPLLARVTLHSMLACRNCFVTYFTMTVFHSALHVCEHRHKCCLSLYIHTGGLGRLDAIG